jgi:hypothetical protein
VKRSSKIEKLMSAKQKIAQEQFQTRNELAEKKQVNKIRKCESIREEEKQSLKIERFDLRKKRDENRVMMMDPLNMDPLTKEWWKILGAEILEGKKEIREIVVARVAFVVHGGDGGAAFICGGGGATALAVLLW